MTSFSGVGKILRFNWPKYVGAIALSGVVAGLVLRGAVTGWIAIALLAGTGLGLFWMVASLVVSYYVYDASSVARGEWLGTLEPGALERGAIFHAGHDEASEIVARLPGSEQFETFDFFDPERNGSPSLERARARAEERATVIAPDEIPLADGELTLGVLAFAAHEVRDHSERVALFRELERVLSASGRILVVEHLRDAWNFLAYGPGALHFLSRGTWLRTFTDAGLALAGERPCTPFVRVFELEVRS